MLALGGLLQSVLGPVLGSGADSQARTYVDDIALTVEGQTPALVAQRMKGWLRRVWVRLAAKNMVVNRGKEFVYGRSKACLRVWTEAQPEYEGHLTQQVRELGVCVRAYACKNHLVCAKLDVLKIVAGRIGFLPVDRRLKGNMAQAVIFGGGWGGSMVSRLTPLLSSKLRFCGV